MAENSSSKLRGTGEIEPGDSAWWRIHAVRDETPNRPLADLAGAARQLLGDPKKRGEWTTERYAQYEEQRVLDAWRAQRQAPGGAGLHRPLAIYGADSREDIRFVTDPNARTFWEGSMATCLVARAESLTEVAGRPGEDKEYALDTYTLRDHLEAVYGTPCDDVRFLNQPCCPGGTAVLVADDVIVTAGHVLWRLGNYDVTQLRFVFGFEQLEPNYARTEIPAAWVCSGVQLIHRPNPLKWEEDWAVIRITPPRGSPTRVRYFRRSGGPAVGSTLYVLGHPTGLPMKLASGIVRDSSNPRILTTTLDTFAGNSGSPVFSLIAVGGRPALQLEGTLITGEADDYVTVGSCVKPNAISESSGEGATVQRVTNYLQHIPGV